MQLNLVPNYKEGHIFSQRRQLWNKYAMHDTHEWKLDITQKMQLAQMNQSKIGMGNVLRKGQGSQSCEWIQNSNQGFT